MTMMKFFFLVTICLVVPFVTTQLEEGFYTSTCPQAEKIILQVVQNQFNTDHSITAALLRLQFHDCFVNGCDASLLIDPTPTKPSEKLATPNSSVRGFHLIDKIKNALEAVCPSIVSCADIIALATRDAVALAGGPAFPVWTGRRDPSKVSLPGPNFPLKESLNIFTAKNLSLSDMVTLLGAHTVGVAHCGFFQERLTNFNGSNKPDPTMDPLLVSRLIKLCSRASWSDPTSFLDLKTSFRVDNEYYKQIIANRGILKIDQEIGKNKASASLVARLAYNNTEFRTAFGTAMFKMAAIEVLVGKAGEIRKNCRVFNSPSI